MRDMHLTFALLRLISLALSTAFIALLLSVGGRERARLTVT
jgi:hypothetical protein